jgi:hypothetical protein
VEAGMPDHLPIALQDEGAHEPFLRLGLAAHLPEPQAEEALDVLVWPTLR